MEGIETIRIAIGVLVTTNVGLGTKIIFDWLKNGRTKVLDVQIGHIFESIQRIETRLSNLPCVDHGEKIARIDEKFNTVQKSA